MIQRFQVILDQQDKLETVKQGLGDIGFSDDAIRAFHSDDSGIINVYAYRDDDAMEPAIQETDPDQNWTRLQANRMEDYCVSIWSKVGYCECRLVEFNETETSLEFGMAEFENWKDD